MSIFAPGGGGAAGEVNYPPHILMIHQEMLYGSHGTDHDGDAASVGTPPDPDFNVLADVDSARADSAGSPYAAVTAYNPDGDLSALSSRVGDAAGIISSLNPLTDIKDIFAAIEEALRAADLAAPFEDPFDATAITALVNAFDAETQTEHNQRISRILSGHFDVRSIVSTGAQMSVAIAEDARLKAVQTYRRQLELQRDDQRFQQRAAEKAQKDQNLASAANEGARMFGLQVQAALNLASLQDGVTKTQIVAKTDQLNQDLVNEVKDATWDLDLFAYVNQTTAAIAGAATMPRGASEMERRIGMIATLGSVAIQGISLLS